MKRTFFSISLVLTLLILTTSAASACEILKIGSGSEPAIDGNKIAWTDGGSIHIYDLTTKNNTRVGTSAASYPAISGDKLVWLDKSTVVPKLAVYDIKTKARSYITTNIDSGSIPAIYGSKIVWSAGSNVYLRDISTHTQTRIAAGSNPDIHGNKISYDSDSAVDTKQIFVYDITTKKAIDVSKYGDNIASHICGNKVIWSDFYTRLGNIRMYDVSTKKQMEVTTGGTYENGTDYGYDTGGATDISGNRIVYLKHNDFAQMDLGNVYVYDIATGKSRQLSTGNNAQTPVISGNVVVWSSSGNIFMTRL